MGSAQRRTLGNAGDRLAVAAGLGVGARPAVARVCGARRVERRTVVTVESVAATFAEEVVVTRVALQCVVATTGVDRVVVAAARQEVAAAIGEDRVVPRSADDVVVLGATGEIVVALVATNHVVALEGTHAV